MKHSEVPQCPSAPSSPNRHSLGSAVGMLVATRLASVSMSMGVGVILARSLGPSARGELGVGVSVSGILAIALTAGLDVATLRSAGAGDLAAALRATRRRTVLATIVVVMAVPLVPVTGVASRFGLTSHVLMLGLLLTPLIVVTQLLGNCVLGVGRHARWATATLLNMLVYGAAVAAVALVGASSPAAYLAALGAGYVAALITLSHGLKLLGPVAPATAQMNADLRQAARGTAPTTIVQLALLRVPVPLLSMLGGTAAAGMLSVAMPLGEALLVIPVAVGTVLLPAYRAHGQEPNQVRRHARTTALVSGAVGVVLCLLAPVAIPFIYGAQFGEVTQLVLIIVPGFVVFSYGRVFQSSLQADAEYLSVNVASSVGFGILLLLHAVLVPLLGTPGSALALSAGLAAMGLGLVLADRKRRKP